MTVPVEQDRSTPGGQRDSKVIIRAVLRRAMTLTRCARAMPTTSCRGDENDVVHGMMPVQTLHSGLRGHGVGSALL